MENKIANRITGSTLIRYAILVYWVLFWLINIVDKLIGGAHFLFVGKDRFAQIERFFDSLGLGHPMIANIALTITACVEIFAFIFFVGALYHVAKKNIETAHSWFFLGITLTLITFTYFTVGDQFFGDHFELLEHGLFWFITLLSWFIFIWIEKFELLDSFSMGRKQFIAANIFIFSIASVTTFSIFWHNHTSFNERYQAVHAVKISDNRYKIQFPFLAGSKAFENTIAQFKSDNPTETITYLYTAPAQLRLGESDGLIIYIQTEKR
jgi:hypothetical protein